MPYHKLYEQNLRLVEEKAELKKKADKLAEALEYARERIAQTGDVLAIEKHIDPILKEYLGEPFENVK